MTKTKNLLLTILLVCGATVWGNNGLKIRKNKSIKANDFTNKRYE